MFVAFCLLLWQSEVFCSVSAVVSIALEMIIYFTDIHQHCILFLRWMKPCFVPFIPPDVSASLKLILVLGCAPSHWIRRSGTGSWFPIATSHHWPITASIPRVVLWPAAVQWQFPLQLTPSASYHSCRRIWNWFIFVVIISTVPLQAHRECVRAGFMNERTISVVKHIKQRVWYWSLHPLCDSNMISFVKGSGAFLDDKPTAKAFQVQFMLLTWVLISL